LKLSHHHHSGRFHAHLSSPFHLPHFPLLIPHATHGHIPGKPESVDPRTCMLNYIVDNLANLASFHFSHSCLITRTYHIIIFWPILLNYPHQIEDLEGDPETTNKQFRRPNLAQLSFGFSTF